MKKYLKSKTAVIVLSVALLTTGANVYATSALNSSLLALIQDGVGTVTGFFVKDAREELVLLNQGKKQELNNFVDERGDQIITDLDKTKKTEVERAKAEIDVHYKDLVTQTDNAIADETAKGKEKIKAAVNEELTKAKNDLSAELERSLKAKMDELKSNNGIGYGSGY